MNLVGSYEMKKKSLECVNVKQLTTIPHFHAEWEAIICLSGSALVHTNSTSFELKKNEMALIAPYSFHFYNSHQGDFIVMCFDTEAMPILKKRFTSERPEKAFIDFSVDEVLYNTVIHFKEMFSTRYASGEFIDPTVSVGFVNLIMLFSESYFDFSRFDFKKENISHKIMNYCLENYRQTISLDNLSDILGYSKGYISHNFNLNTQISLTTFVNWLRISEACNLLGNVTKSITDIAHEVGFGSLRAFNRIFLKYMLRSPSDYRKNGLKP